MINVHIKGPFLFKIMYKTMTSDVTENKINTTISIWAICDFESSLTMTVHGGILFTMFDYVDAPCQKYTNMTEPMIIHFQL